MLAVEDKVIALWSEKDSRRFAEQNEGEAISVFGSAVKEKLVRINTVLNGAADKGENVEYDRWTMRVGKPYLSNHVGDDGQDDYDADR
jgi:hypothetical protein